MMVRELVADLKGPHRRLAIGDDAHRAIVGAEVGDHEYRKVLREVGGLRKLRRHSAHNRTDHDAVNDLQGREGAASQWERRLYHGSVNIDGTKLREKEGLTSDKSSNYDFMRYKVTQKWRQPAADKDAARAV